MPNSLELLRELASNTTPSTTSTFEPKRLRFVLEVPLAGRDTAAVRELTRSQLEDLLQSKSFELQPLFDQAAGGVVFLVLSFPGVQRTLPPDVLFQLARQIQNDLQLVSCEPDTGDKVFADPDARRGTESESAIIDFFCQAPGQAPSDHRWALENTRVIDAWTHVPSLGADVRIAHLDTGITDHPEVADIIKDLPSALNLLEGSTDPTDPLRVGTANPGHGTGTSSAAASGQPGTLVGAAPRATLIPIRCIEDVKVFEASPIAKGVEHAINVGAHVITMSLGGIGSRALESALHRAVLADMIIVAASGNCIGLVVWPAAYPDVIAVGGSNAADGTWKGTSFGSKIEFSAPAEFVWVADRRTNSDPPGQLNAGQGTSFATALSAGIAALWLAKFERSKVIAEARLRNVHVQDLFRAAVRQTSRVPNGWNSAANGSGIVDADALLKLPLKDIKLSAAAIGGLEAALEAVMGPGKFDENFDWNAHGAEVSAMLVADAKEGRSPAPGRTEAKAFRLPSGDLSNEVTKSSDGRLSRLMKRSNMPPPALVTKESPDAQRNARLICNLGAIASGGMTLESTEVMTVEAGQARLTNDAIREVLAPLEARLKDNADPRLSGLVQNLAQGINALHLEGPDARLSEIHTVSLEALVELKGRPALRVTTREGAEGPIQTVDGNDDTLGGFKGLVNIALPQLEERCLDRVGRIDADGSHIGTGFVVGDGLILTNRHVLQALASPVPVEKNPKSWLLVRTATINFSPDADDSRYRFLIREVAFAGPDPIIDDAIDYNKLDLALLRVDKTNQLHGKFPEPIAMSSGSKTPNTKLLVVGYPAAPSQLPVDDVGRVRQDVVEALRRIYGLDYGKKFFSPGYVKATTVNWKFDHDATTLGGNSGSLVGNFADMKVLGLHFAGDWLSANHAHDLDVVLARTPDLKKLIP